MREKENRANKRFNVFTTQFTSIVLMPLLKEKIYEIVLNFIFALDYIEILRWLAVERFFFRTAFFPLTSIYATIVVYAAITLPFFFSLFQQCFIVSPKQMSCMQRIKVDVFEGCGLSTRHYNLRWVVNNDSWYRHWQL